MYGLNHDALEAYWNLTIIARNETSKVPKLQNIPSATSTGTAKCSTISSLSHAVSSDVTTRGPSLGSIPGPWFSSEHVMQTAMQTAVAPSTQAQESAGGPSTTLTGYCDTVIRANPQTLARRDHGRPTDIPILEYSRQNERNASQPRILNGPDTSLGFVQAFHDQRRSLGAFNPPSLTSKSTLSTLQSTLSTGGRDSQSQRSTATYLEQSCDRLSLPIPRNFPGANASGALEFHKSYPRLTGILAMNHSSIRNPSQRSGYFSSARTVHSYQPASLQQHSTHTMDDDPS